MEKIAYLIQAHNDAEHLMRLVLSLNEKADFFIHIDKKQDITPFTEKLSLPNVFFIQNRKKVYWGGINQVLATLETIEICLLQSIKNGVAYKKILMISGSCYPVKNNHYIHNFLDVNINFIRGTNITTTEDKKYNNFIKNYFFFDFHFINNFCTRFMRKILSMFMGMFFKKPLYIVDKNNNRNNIYHGSQWWAVNEDLLTYFLNFSKQNKEYLNYFRYSFAPDEKYFHTIFFNSKFAKTNLYNGDESFDSFTSSFANLHIIDPSLTKWFDIKDFDIIQNSDKIFVRKVSTKISKTLLDKIDDELLGKNNKKC